MIIMRIEQLVRMDDEIAHVGIVHRRLRLGLPRRIGLSIVGESPDHLDLGQVTERHRFHIGQFAANQEVKKLLIGHVSS